MKLNTATILKDLDGMNLKDNYVVEEEKDGKTVRVQKERDLTVGNAVSGALVSGAAGKDLTPVRAAELYALAMRIRSSDNAILKSEEVTDCKNVIVKAYHPLISGQVIHLLEGGPDESE